MIIFASGVFGLCEWVGVIGLFVRLGNSLEYLRRPST